MRKWTSLGLAVVLVLAGIWYFFVKGYDYKISFQTTAAPGTVYLRALHWKPEMATIIKRMPYESLIQKWNLKGSLVKVKWEFTPLNDSLTLVEANTLATNNNFLERLKLLVRQSSQQEKMAGEVKSFKDHLEKDKELFDIIFMGESVIPESICACIPLKSSIEKKASGMMQNINLLHEYMKQHDLELAGKPRVNVTDWNPSANQIEFDFCFPLAGTLELPNTPLIRIKKIPSQKALKTEFRGNYIFSHHAWLQLLNLAEMHGYEVAGPPLEIFIDNPELGRDSRNWKAEVYLPVK